MIIKAVRRSDGKFFVDKHAVVTGGANGIGQCIAKSFLDRGAFVVIIDTDKEAGVALSKHYDRLLFFPGDIADRITLENFVHALNRPVDFLINNACLGRKGLLSDCSWEDFEYVQRVGVTAPYCLTNMILRRGLLNDGASIINIASTRALQSQADTESYSAAKGGILALTHAMSVSLAGRARVNAISPGWIETATYQADTAQQSASDKRQHPAGRIGVPEDIAQMALFLCDNSRSGFITGENIVIDGGMSKLMIYHDDNGWRYDE